MIMNYLKTNSLSIIETNINKFKSLYLSQDKSIHLVLQSVDGYLLKLTDVDESTKELYSFISTTIPKEQDGELISKDDLIFLITSTKLSFTGEQSLKIMNIDKLEKSKVQKNIEIKFKGNILNLLKV